MRISSGVIQLLQDPVEAYHKAVGQWHERNDRNDLPCEYVPDEDWRERLGVSGEDRDRTGRLCHSIEATLTAKGIRPGPESYLFWNDGVPAFLQAIWSLIRRLNAVKVVETGVAHGVSSRIILEAMRGRGRLWSIDLPPLGAGDAPRDRRGDRRPGGRALVSTVGSTRRNSPRCWPRSRRSTCSFTTATTAIQHAV